MNATFIYTLEDLPNEQWKEIIDYPGYFISNLGRVKSTKKANDSILKPQKDFVGYYHVRLYNKHSKNRFYKNGMQIPKLFKVHRLVGLHFLDTRRVNTSEMTINHLNGLKDDNRAENLEWVTIGANLRHAYQTGLIDRSGPGSKVQRNTPIAVTLPSGEVKYYRTVLTAAIDLGVAAETIRYRLKRKVTKYVRSLHSVRYLTEKEALNATYTVIPNMEQVLWDYNAKYRKYYKNSKES